MSQPTHEPHLFVSYSHVDRDITDRIVILLRKSYSSVWYDESISGGQEWLDLIHEEIASCDVFLYLLSNESISSSYCQDEYKEAVRLRKQILPILVRARTTLPEDLKNLQYVDFSAGTTPDAVNSLQSSLIHLERRLPQSLLNDDIHRSPLIGHNEHASRPKETHPATIRILQSVLAGAFILVLSFFAFLLIQPPNPTLTSNTATYMANLPSSVTLLPGTTGTGTVSTGTTLPSSVTPSPQNIIPAISVAIAQSTCFAPDQLETAITGKIDPHQAVFSVADDKSSITSNDAAALYLQEHQSNMAVWGTCAVDGSGTLIFSITPDSKRFGAMEPSNISIVINKSDIDLPSRLAAALIGYLRYNPTAFSNVGDQFGQLAKSVVMPPVATSAATDSSPAACEPAAPPISLDEAELLLLQGNSLLFSGDSKRYNDAIAALSAARGNQAVYGEATNNLALADLELAIFDLSQGQTPPFETNFNQADCLWTRLAQDTGDPAAFYGNINRSHAYVYYHIETLTGYGGNISLTTAKPVRDWQHDAEAACNSAVPQAVDKIQHSLASLCLGIVWTEKLATGPSVTYGGADQIQLMNNAVAELQKVDKTTAPEEFLYWKAFLAQQQASAEKNPISATAISATELSYRTRYFCPRPPSIPFVAIDLLNSIGPDSVQCP